MDSIGSKMFKERVIAGGALGLGAGLVTGYLKGQADGNSAASQLSETTVEVPAYQKPVEAEDVYIDYDIYKQGETPSPNLYGRGKIPSLNADGTVIMETVPAQKVTGLGNGSISYITKDISMPTVHLEEKETYYRTEYYQDSDGNTQSRTVRETDTDYHTFSKSLGQWKEPTVTFEGDTVKKEALNKNLLMFSVLGLGLGAVGAAIFDVVTNQK